MATVLVAPYLQVPQISYGRASGEPSDVYKYTDILRKMFVGRTMADVFDAMGDHWIGWTSA